MTDNQEKFCSLMREYRTDLYRIAAGILRNHTDAEDAVSEMTCKAFANFHKLKSLESFKPWAIKILVNEAYNIAKKRGRVEPLDDTTDECMHTDMLEAYELWNAVQLLDDEFRTPTILFYYEDMSIKEIGKILSLPQGTVNSRLYRSREKLKKILASNGGCINE